ncbi:MAG: hypothetical protein Q4F06_03335 [Eubacteriales bacterium]|nr:hypothetical protein [Eubacteriales bacterium]
MVDIYFDKLYKYPRIQECVGTAIPFKKGELYSIDNCCVVQEGEKCLTQPKVTAYYEDGSIKFVYVKFAADLPANKGTSVQFMTENELAGVREHNNEKCSPAVVEPLESGYFINLGELCFAVKNNSNGIFEMVDDKRRIYTADNFEGPFLKDEEDNLYDTVIGEWEIVESGPVEIILSAKGSNTSKDKKVDFEIRVSGYAGKPWLQVAYRIINTTDDELKIKSLVFYMKKDGESEITDKMELIEVSTGNDSTGCGDILTDNSNNDGPVFMTRGVNELAMIEKKAPVSGIRTMVGTSNYKTSFTIGKDGQEVNLIIDDKYLLKEANEHYAEVFYGTFFTDYTDETDGFCITVYQAQQNYPKAVKSCKEGIGVMLVPEGVGSVVMQSGMAKEQSFLIHFHEPELPIWEIDNRSLIYQMVDKPYVKPEVYKQSGSMLDVFPEKLDEDVEIMLYAKADSHTRCYGMLNWGDTIDGGYTVQGRGGGKPVFSNNEYDYPHACALMYARTGTRRFLDYLTVAAKHWMDVDVCHYSNNPLYVGGQWEHTAGHCKNGVMVCSHEWVEGLLDYYHLTGDERGYETAVGIGDNVLRLLDTPMYQVPGEASARETGWALRTLTALYVETHDKKWLDKCDWIIESFKTWEKEYGNWLAPYTDNTVIRVGFMISVAIGSVMRYYRVFPGEDIKDMILRAVDDLIENCMMDNGLFYYKELPSLSRNGSNALLLESLAIAYELTGNKEYLVPGIKTFANLVNQTVSGAVGNKQVIDDCVICQGNATKNFAQSFIPLITYYKALSENNMTFRQ